jgi:regulator of protease activity HflC (stomatin/prohibitin superfamily)
MFLTKTVISPQERGLRFVNGALTDILQPGVYWGSGILGQGTIEVRSITDPAFDCDYVDILLDSAPASVTDHFVIANISDDEVGLVYYNGRLSRVLPPGTRQLFWREPQAVVVNVINYREQPRVPEAVAGLLSRRDTALNSIRHGTVAATRIAQGTVGLVMVDGVLVEMLQPGFAMYWQFDREVKIRVTQTRVVTSEVCGQEILTRDRVSLRINLSAAYQIVDPMKAETVVADADEYIYRELQLALRRAIGTRSLDELLADKKSVDQVIEASVAEPLTSVGVDIKSVGIKDIILPGEMKDILNQVVLAEKTAQANNIRRREETAATRSLLNTAKLMDENPLLIRLKELETLEKVTDRVERLTVFGGLDGVLKDMVNINP